jgi:hypothetical protein
MSATAKALPQRAEDCPRDRSVFINCPYDGRFRGIFDAMIFTILAAGLWPRWAAEGGSTDTRLDRILRGLRGSRFSIHDLSRSKGEGKGNFARMNMPLELGMAMEMGFPQHERDHRWGAILSRQREHQQFVSDLNAFDLGFHDFEPRYAVIEVLKFLEDAEAPIRPALKGNAVAAKLPAWDDQLSALRAANLNRREPAWRDIVRAGLQVARMDGR